MLEGTKIMLILFQVNIGIFIAVLRVLSRFGTGDEHKTKAM